MSNAYVIEIREEAVGIVVSQGGRSTEPCGHRFYAASPLFRPIEGRIFSAPAQAQKAAAALDAARSTPFKDRH